MSVLKKILLVAVAAVSLSGCSLLDKKNIAGLQVITNDVSSSLFLDGQYLDKTPYINKEIKPGSYTLKIQPENQKLIPYETQVTLRKGTLTVVTWNPGNKSENSGGVIYEMEKINSNQGELSFITIPNNSIITFDQGEQQFSPLVLKDIEPGHHQFEISLPSYEKQHHTINIIKGYRINVTAKLAKAKYEADKTQKSETSDTNLESSSSAHKDETVKNLIMKESLEDVEATQTASISGQAVKINKTSFFQDGKEVLKVRKKANPTAEIIGYAKVGKSYSYLDEANGWFKIKIDNQSGWVSGHYAQLLNY